MIEVLVNLCLLCFIGTYIYSIIQQRLSDIHVMEEHISHLLEERKRAQEYTKALETILGVRSNYNKIIQLPLPGFDNL